MEKFAIYYAILGLFTNLLTMFNKETRSYWFEWGPTGFVVQLTVSVILFPPVAYMMIKDVKAEGIKINEGAIKRVKKITIPTSILLLIIAFALYANNAERLYVICIILLATSLILSGPLLSKLRHKEPEPTKQ